MPIFAAVVNLANACGKSVARAHSSHPAVLLSQTEFTGERKAWKVSYEQWSLKGTVFLLKVRARSTFGS